MALHDGVDRMACSALVWWAVRRAGSAAASTFAALVSKVQEVIVRKRT